MVVAGRLSCSGRDYGLAFHPRLSDESCCMETATKKLTVDQPDFRAYEPEWVDAGGGVEALMQLCEDRDPESGRWEPFYAMLEHRRSTPVTLQ